MDLASTAQGLLDYASRGMILSLEQKDIIAQAGLDPERKPEEDQLDDRHHLTIQEYLAGCPDEWKLLWAPNEIKKKDWMPETNMSVSKEYLQFINSSIPRFDKLAPYEPFYLYVEQARRWYNETKDIDILSLDPDSAIPYKVQELNRIRDNKLYAVDRYGKVREEGLSGGARTYKAGVPQALLAHVYDCKYDIELLKGRHSAITSTFMLFAVFDSLTISNFMGALLTDDKEGTAENLLDKKFKGSLGLLDQFLVVDVRDDSRWTKNLVVIDTSRSDKKLGVGLNSSEFFILPTNDPQVTNSKTITKSFFDEAQKIALYNEIQAEINPTKRQNIDGKLQRTRQSYAWGCVCAGTKVWTADGRFINIEDLKKKDGIIGYDGVGASLEPITHWNPPADKECYRITTNTGRYLECSWDHPILWGRSKSTIFKRVDGKQTWKKRVEFKNAQDILVGDQVATIQSVPIFGTKKMWEPRIIGWLIGDGTYGQQRTPRLASCDVEINSYVDSVIDTVVTRSHTTKDGRLYRETTLRGTTDRLRSLGILGQTGISKRLPDDIHSYTKEDICELLGGLFDTDGCVHYTGNHHSIDLTSSSYGLLNEVRFLLHKIGVSCNITRVKANCLTNPKDKNDWYVLDIGRKVGVDAFHKSISFRVAYKQRRLESIVEQLKNRNPRRDKHIDGVVFERVVDVQPIGMKPVYNLTAGKSHTYVANGIITHNTGASADTGGGAFRDSWRKHYVQQRDLVQNTSRIILFFDWTCRPGITKQDYIDAKQEQLGGSDSTGNYDRDLAIFCSAYPSNPEDSFMETHNTVVPPYLLKRVRDRLDSIPDKYRPIPGYYKPICDANGRWLRPDFIRVEEGDPRGYVKRFLPPSEEPWLDRYYQGTDPIQSASGLSEFASAAFDSVGYEAKGCCQNDQMHFHPTVACLLNGRTMHAKDMYEQSALMNMDYANYGQRGCMELVEWNQGQDYLSFKQAPNVDQRLTLLLRTKLREALQGGKNSIYGIDMKHGRKFLLLRDLEEMCWLYWHNIVHREFWNQLQTIAWTETGDTKKWHTKDEKKYRDDVVDAVLFSKLCCDSVGNKPRRYGSHEAPKEGTRIVVKRISNGMGGTALVEQEEVYEMRY